MKFLFLAVCVISMIVVSIFDGAGEKDDYDVNDN